MEKKKTDYRVEMDSIGTKKVPENVYYGIQTLRAAENFHINLQLRSLLNRQFFRETPDKSEALPEFFPQKRVFRPQIQAYRESRDWQ